GDHARRPGSPPFPPGRERSVTVAGTAPVSDRTSLTCCHRLVPVRFRRSTTRPGHLRPPLILSARKGGPKGQKGLSPGVCRGLLAVAPKQCRPGQLAFRSGFWLITW